jgi:hypothetical protein
MKTWFLAPLACVLPLAAHAQMMLGANVHEDQGGPYNASLAQQASDLTTIFGSGALARSTFSSPSQAATDVPALQSDGVRPIVGIDTYPPWGSFSSRQAAYQWGYQNAAAMAQAAPSTKYFEIGNEWSTDPSNFPRSDNQMTAGAWTSGPNFQDAVAVTAGAIAAIRQYDPGAAIIAGAIGGWTQEGFAVALAQALRQEYPGKMWDYTVLHWYNASGVSQMGDNPANFDGGQNAYQVLDQIGKPIAVTEFGANNPSDLTAMLQSFAQNGVVLATAYELYANARWNYPLINGGSVTSLGQALQVWRAANGAASTPPTVTTNTRRRSGRDPPAGPR